MDVIMVIQTSIEHGRPCANLSSYQELLQDSCIKRVLNICTLHT